jgi:hypothetical protein
MIRGFLTRFSGRTSPTGIFLLLHRAATYFDERGFTGKSNKQIMPCILLTWSESLTNKITSALWSAKLIVPVSGEYTFDLQSMDNTSVFIDAKKVISNTAQPVTGNCAVYMTNASIYLNKGSHSLKINYDTNILDKQGIGKQYCIGLSLLWKKPGDKNETMIPGNLLFPDE